VAGGTQIKRNLKGWKREQGGSKEKGGNLFTRKEKNLGKPSRVGKEKEENDGEKRVPTSWEQTHNTKRPKRILEKK